MKKRKKEKRNRKVKPLKTNREKHIEGNRNETRRTFPKLG